MVKISWTFQAIDDIENIAEFIAKDSERYAQIQVHRFFEAAKILETHPIVGRIAPELNKQSGRLYKGTIGLSIILLTII